MEAIVERFNLRKILNAIKVALTCGGTIACYHIAGFLALCYVAAINGNNTFIWGLAVAIVALLVMFMAGCAISDYAHDSRVAEYFELSENILTARQYLWLTPLPTILIILSSCTIWINPKAFWTATPCSNPVAVIERAGTGSLTVVKPGNIEFFIPGRQQVQWRFLRQEIAMYPILKTQDGKAIQGSAKAIIYFSENNESIMENYRQYNTQEKFTSAIERDMNFALKEALSRYKLTSLPSQIVIEDLIGTNMDFKKFGIKSITIELTDIHRHFEVE